MIGIIFARSLHYQFYCWYFHSIPLVLWQSKLPGAVSLLVMALVEIAFNVYPATAWSSSMLQISHLILLLAIFTTDIPEEETTESSKSELLKEKEKAKKI
jgi:alpha-1,3-mannosyltransferase